MDHDFGTRETGNDTAGIKSSSTINHKLRVKLGLTCDEYVVLTFVHDATGSIDTGVLPNEDIFWKYIGMRKADYNPIFRSLREKGFITNQGRDIFFTDKYLSNLDSSGSFEELWKLFKKGNRKTAETRFKSVIKKVPFQELKEKAILYQKSVANREFEHRKGLDVWLNPVKEHWNDPIGTVEQSSTKVRYEFGAK